MNQEQRNDLRRLAAAIRVGSQNTEQGFGFYWHDNGYACALASGAIGLGANLAGGEDYYVCGVVYEAIRDMAPGVRDIISNCPIHGYDDARTICGLVEHLNDNHRWTREAIADWLDSLADQDEVTDELLSEFERATLPIMERV